MKRYLMSGLAMTVASLALAPVAKAQEPAAPTQTPGQTPTQQQVPGQTPTQQQVPGQAPTQQQVPGQTPTQQQTPGQPTQQPMMPERQPTQELDRSSSFNMDDISEPMMGPVPRTGQTTLHDDAADFSGTGEVTLGDLIMYNREQRQS